MKKKIGLLSIKYAETPLIFVTKKDVNISNLIAEELIKIFRCQREAWPEGKRIHLI